MTRSCVLGVDVSTAELRVHVLDLDSGRTVATAATPLAPVTGADGCREQDVDFGRAALETIDQAVAALPEPAVVRAVSVTSTSGSVVPVDVAGRQRGPARMYNDNRAATLDAELQRHSDGRPVSMLARAATLLADVDDASVSIASVAQVIEAALAGAAMPGDTSHFLKAGVDPSSGGWPLALLEHANIPVDRLPHLVQPGTRTTVVAVGSATGAAIVAGMTDGCTSQLATGTVGRGESVGVIGTTFVLKVVESIDRHDAASGVYSHRAPDGLYWAGGASNVGGGSFVRPESMSYAELDRGAEALGASAVVAYPLPRAGERFPVADPRMPPFTVDLDGNPAPLPSDPVTRYRSVLEGVAMVERYALESLGIDPGAAIRTLSGGATRSAIWNRIRSATLGVQVRLPEYRDSAHGAAVLAAWAAGDEDFATVVTRYTGRGTVLDPETELAERMAERYSVFTAALAESQQTAPN